MDQNRQNNQVGFTAIRRVFPTIVLLAMFISLVGNVAAARTVNGIKFVDVKSSSNPLSPNPITIVSSRNFDIVVNVTTTTAGSGGANWSCTTFAFTGPASVTRTVNTPDVSSAGTYAIQHTVQAPATAGTYNLTVTAYSDNSCSNNAAASPLYTGVVTVVSTPAAGVTVNTANPHWGVLNATLTENFASTTTWNGTEYRYREQPSGTWSNWTCVNTDNITGTGSYTQTFNISMPLDTTIPPATRTYDLEVRRDTESGCDGANGTTRSTTFTLQENNPPLAKSCALEVMMILDESNSISNAGLQTSVRNGLIDIVEALNGTGSYMNVVEFNNHARKAVINGKTGEWQPIDNNYATTYFPTYINGTGNSTNPGSWNPGSPSAEGGTNWDDALLMTRQIPRRIPNKQVLVLFVTDGEPTYYTPGDGFITGIPSGPGSSFSQPGLNEAAYWANEIKTVQGNHLFLAGFGDITGNLTAVREVSGMTALLPNGSNLATADYMAVTADNISDLTNALVNSIIANCGNSLTITNYYDTLQGPLVAPDWDFANTVNVTEPGEDDDDYTWIDPVTGHASSVGQTKSDTTDDQGEAYWQWEPGPDGGAQPWSTNATFNETLKPDYKFVKATCDIKEFQEGVPVTVDTVTVNIPGSPLVPAPDPIASLDLDSGQFAVCEVYHRQDPEVSITLDGPPVVTPGEKFDYTVNYENIGPVDVTDVQVVITLPPQVRLDPDADPKYIIGDNPNGAVCQITDNGPNNDGYGATITCGNPGAYLKDLPTGESGPPITLKVQVDPNWNGDTTGFEADATLNAVSVPWGPATADDNVSTTPVTVSYFSATETAGGVRFDWSTATETGNAGFNLYARTADGNLVRLNDEIILSTVIDSSAPTDYSVELAGVPAGEYFIQDVSLFGELRAHDAIGLNGSFGERTTPEAIDWAAIQAENAMLEQARAAAAADQQSAGPRPAGPQAEQINGGATTDGATTGAETTATRGSSYPSLDLRLSETGIYRLTYEQIKAAGVDLRGVSRRDLALTNHGESVPLYVSRARFGPGAYIEFIGQGLDTLYTDTNVYRLVVDRAMASRVTAVQGRPSPSATVAPYYMETTTVENNNIYSYLSPNGDPWADTFISLTPGMAIKYTDFPISISDYVPGAAASVQFDLWGASNVISGPDHHALVAVNGAEAANVWFDGNEVKLIDAPLPNNVLQNGLNTLRLTAPVDSGADFDTFAVESYGLTYPRAFVAMDGRLDFEAKADARAFKVTGLDSDQVVVYRLNGGRPARLNGVKVAADGNGYSAGFAGGKNDTYFVSTVGALLTPQIALTPAAADITGGSADLLIIAHPNFINGDLNRLVQARQAQGYAVKVVNVNEVYAQFGGGIFDPQAIRDYLGVAIDKMGVEYVLLVGADTYDYRNYSGVNSISFIPSLYANTLDPVKLAPVDPLYVDIDGDNVPDRALGRFPVRTVAEMKLMVDKTLLYDEQTGVQTAVLAADYGFQNDSEAFASPLVNSGWTVQRAYIQSMGNAAARATLIAGLNAGPRLASFVGHSGQNNWTFNPLFLSGDAAALTNVNPILVTQWGCWNTYYVDPTYNTMGHKFLLSGMNGAALVTGSTTLTNSSSERQLGRLMMAQLAQPGMTIGEAMQLSKASLAQTHPEMHDVLLGWTILGDPTTVVMR